MIPGNIANTVPLTSREGFALDNPANIIIHGNGAITTTNTVTAAEFIGPIAYANSAGNAAFATLAANANFATQAANAAYSDLAGNALYAEDSNHTVTADFAVLAANANYSLNAGNAVTSDTANFAANAGFSTLAGHVTDPSQPNITAVGTLASLAVSADITAGNVYANGGTVGAATLVGTLAAGPQPNITSLGNLTSLYVAGPATIEGALLVSDDAAITGNLTISGNLNYTSSNNLSIQSPIIEVGGGPNGSPLTTNDGQDRGLYMHVYDSNVATEVNKFMGWDTSIGEFRFSSNATIANNVITTNEYGNVRANNFYGNFTGNVSGVAANAIHAQVADVANSVAGANVVGDVVGADHANVADVANSVAGANVVGIVANANYAAFSGVAATANLVAGANVTGEVAHAAVANSVAAANIVGIVANANYAAFSGVAASANTVAGANVTGQVGFAAVANSVAAANIVGTVANANHAAFSNVANTANVAVTVAGANVTGQVAYAAVANSVAGANVGGQVAYAAVANSVAGANVSGEVSYAAVANSVAGANVSGYVADANHANISDAANIAYALSSDLANVEITGGNAGAFLQTDGTGNLTWATPTVGSAIENGGSNVSIPVANGDIELWVGGLWVGNISADNSNVTSNFTAGGNLEGGNLVTGGGVFAFDATVTDIYATGLAQFSNVGNIQILGGSNTQVLTTDGTGNLRWSNPGLNYKYTKEWHVDPVNGNDITGDGSYNKPFATVARAISFTGPTYAQVVYLHAGVYSENLVIVSPTENIEIIGVADTGTTQCTGTWAFSHTGTSIRVSNIRWTAAVTQTSTGPVYFDNCTLSSFNKTGTAYTQFDLCDVTSATFNGNALTLCRGGSITGLTLSNVGARVYVYNMTAVTTTVVTAGVFFAFDSTLYSSTTTTNAVTTSAGTTVGFYRTNITNSSGTLSRVSLAGNWTINDTTYDLSNSVLTGTNLGTVSHFDALTVRGSTISGNVYANSGTVMGNLLTGTLTTPAQPNITTVGTLTSLTMAGNILPSASNTYNLGSNTQRWNTLYLSNNTLYLGETAISADANSNVLVNGNALAVITGGVIDATAANANISFGVDADVANVLIYGGIDGQALLTNGSGNLYWDTVDPTDPVDAAWITQVADDLGNPQYPSVGTFSGTTRTASTQAELVTAIGASTAGDIVQITADITLTSTLTIDKAIKLTGGFILQSAGAAGDPVTLITVTAAAYIDDTITVKHRKTTNTSVETAVNVNATGFVSEATVEFMEFGYVLRGSFRIGGRTTYTGALGNNHRHIGIYNLSAPSIIDGVIFDFPQEATARSNFIYVSSNNAVTERFESILRVTGCSHALTKYCRQFFLGDAWNVTGRNASLWFDNNIWDDLNGGIGIYNGDSATSPLNVFNGLVFFMNSQGTAGDTSFKGLVYIDGAGTVREIGAPTVLAIDKNSAPQVLRSDYSWCTSGVIAYKNTGFTAATLPVVTYGSENTAGVFANIRVTGVSTLGAVANVRITGGANNQLLRTDGAGNLSFANALTWVTAPASNVAAGIAGQAAYDAGGNLYVCVATNTWSKISGSTSW